MPQVVTTNWIEGSRVSNKTCIQTVQLDKAIKQQLHCALLTREESMFLFSQGQLLSMNFT